MFEFEDDDFTLMESFSLTAAEDGYADFEGQDLTRGSYLGDGVWVVDAQENPDKVKPLHAPVSGS